MIDVRGISAGQMTNTLIVNKLAVIAGIVAVAAFGAEAVAATATTADGTISVTLSAPDTVVVGKPFVATVQVQNLTSTTIGIASATAQYPRSAFKVQALSSPTPQAVCEKATSNHGATGFAACGNVPLAPGETITTNVGLQSSPVGSLTIGSYGFTATGPLVQGTFTSGPSITVNSVKK